VSACRRTSTGDDSRGAGSSSGGGGGSSGSGVVRGVSETESVRASADGVRIGGEPGPTPAAPAPGTAGQGNACAPAVNVILTPQGPVRTAQRKHARLARGAV
jgi:hypothetical protein